MENSKQACWLSYSDSSHWEDAAKSQSYEDARGEPHISQRSFLWRRRQVFIWWNKVIKRGVREKKNREREGIRAVPLHHCCAALSKYFPVQEEQRAQFNLPRKWVHFRRLTSFPLQAESRRLEVQDLKPQRRQVLASLHWLPEHFRDDFKAHLESLQTTFLNV